MATQISRPQLATLALLLEAEAVGVRGLTRTTLVKLLYLLDVYFAEESGGKQIWTGLEWKFHHFGPYSNALEAELDAMDAKALLDKDEKEKAGREFVVYRAAKRGDGRPLSDLGLPSHVATSINQAIREYAYELPKLLDYVYFSTAPMRDARPGDVLSFADCRRVNYRDEIKQVALKPISGKNADRARALIEALRAKQDKGTGSSCVGIRDELYFSLKEEADAITEVGDLVASLEFPRRGANGGN